MKKLAGKIALVTGGAKGIGFAIARRFVDEGAAVALVARRQEQAAAAASQLDGDVLPIALDTSNDAQWREGGRALGTPQHPCKLCWDHDWSQSG